MPIQLARTTQLESYEQTFYFSEATGDFDDLETQMKIGRQIDDYFLRMIGEDNWQVVKDKYGFGPLRDELLSGSLKLKGVLVSVLSVDAYDQDRFFFEGSGRFFLVREANGEILLAGDFLISPKSHSIDSLQAGSVHVDVQLFISRIPNEITRFHNSVVRYEIQLDTSRARYDVYSLDYAAEHPVYLLGTDRAGRPTEDRIGSLQFEGSIGASKILDLRGREFLRKDYGRLPRSTDGAN